MTGGYRRVTPDVFEPRLRELLGALRQWGVVTVVIGLHTPDEFFWPRSTASGLEYEAATRRVLRDFPDASFHDPKPILRRWADFLDDHAHFNEQGHAKVADLVWTGLTVRYGLQDLSAATPAAGVVATEGDGRSPDSPTAGD